MQQVGTPTTVYYAQRLGIESPLPVVPSLALGTGEVTLLELTSAYTAFANRGITSLPRLFTRVEDADGVALHFQEERHRRALSEGTAYMMSSMLSDVISGGTASRRPRRGLQAAGGGEDRDDRRLLRRLVRRIYAASGHRRLVRSRSAGADHGARVRRHGRRPGVGRVHEGCDGGREA